MNVDIFGGKDGDDYPNVGWYFLAAIILMMCGQYPLFLSKCKLEVLTMIPSAASVVLCQAFVTEAPSNSVSKRSI